jgi:hypothetical protein
MQERTRSLYDNLFGDLQGSRLTDPFAKLGIQDDRGSDLLAAQSILFRSGLREPHEGFTRPLTTPDAATQTQRTQDPQLTDKNRRTDSFVDVQSVAQEREHGQAGAEGTSGNQNADGATCVDRWCT